MSKEYTLGRKELEAKALGCEELEEAKCLGERGRAGPLCQASGERQVFSSWLLRALRKGGRSQGRYTSN